MNSFSFVRKTMRNGPRTRTYETIFNSKLRLFSSSVITYSNKESQQTGLPKNTLEEYITAHKQPTYGQVYDKKPFKVHLKANKVYKWCTCGWSKSQPFCDGTHKNPYIKIALRPVMFSVEEEKDYYLCNCKQTAHRPFCDGTHKRQDIQEQIKTY